MGGVPLVSGAKPSPSDDLYLDLAERREKANWDVDRWRHQLAVHGFDFKYADGGTGVSSQRLDKDETELYITYTSGSNTDWVNFEERDIRSQLIAVPRSQVRGGSIWRSTTSFGPWSTLIDAGCEGWDERTDHLLMNVPILDTTIEIDESLVDEPPDEIRTQLREYARGDRQTFDLDVEIPDGPLGDVMAAMADIPYGETRSYGELAVALDTAPVAVGRACAMNPAPVIVPCHRVVGSDGSLRGYSAADGVATKRRLLDLETSERGSVQKRLPVER